MIERNDFPKWAYNITTWIMDPWPSPKNQQFAADFVDALGVENGSLGIHSYNWDYLGYSGPENASDHTQIERKDLKCDNKIGVAGKIAPCGFDTHYPEFLPQKKGMD